MKRSITNTIRMCFSAEGEQPRFQESLAGTRKNRGRQGVSASPTVMNTLRKVVPATFHTAISSKAVGRRIGCRMMFPQPLQQHQVDDWWLSRPRRGGQLPPRDLHSQHHAHMFLCRMRAAKMYKGFSKHRIVLVVIWKHDKMCQHRRQRRTHC